MSNQDGKVVIRIDTDALKAAQALDSVNKAFNKNADTVKKAATVTDGYKKVVKDNIAILRELALSCNQNTEGFKKLAAQTKDYKKVLADADKEVIKATQNFKSFKIAGINVNAALKAFSAVAVVKALAAIGKKAIQTAGEFEQLQTSFKIMAGGAEAGEQLTKSLIDLAAKTPMTTSGLAKATRTLLSFGESSENVIEDLKLLGNISGGEEQRFQSLALAFAQIGSTGRLTGQDLLQMVNQGFNPLQTISEKTGKSMAVLKKEMSDGKISFDMVKQAMIDATSEGGRFYGLMEEQSETLNGKLSTLDDTWKLVSKNIGDLFVPAAKTGIQWLINLGNFVQDLTNKLIESRNRTLLFKKEMSELSLSETNAQIKYLSETVNNIKFSYKGNPIERVNRIAQYNKQIQELTVHYKELKANQPKEINNTSGFSNGGNTENGTEKAKKIKDAFEQAQEAYQNAQKALKSAIQQFGENSPQARNALETLQKTGVEVKRVEDAFNRLTSQSKSSLEQLQYDTSEALKKVQNLAASPVVNLEALREAKTVYNNLKLKLDEVNNAANGAYTQLTNQQNQLAAQLRDAFATAGFDADQLQKLITDYQSVSKEIQNINKNMTDTMGKNWDNVSKTISSALGSTLISALQGGQNALQTFSNIAVSLLQQVLNKMLEMVVITPILNAFTGGTGGTIFGAFSGLFSKHANGNVFQNGNVIPFAKGGVVSKPTVFPMANGGTGLMGEAGAEAVMPLRRMSNGRLGVEASNGGDGKAVQVNIYNQSNSQVETRQRDDGSMDIIIKRVNQALMNERTSSGFRAAYQREDRKGLQAV